MGLEEEVEVSSVGGLVPVLPVQKSSLCRRTQNLPTLVLCVDKRFHGVLSWEVWDTQVFRSRKPFHSPRAWRELPGRRWGAEAQNCKGSSEALGRPGLGNRQAPSTTATPPQAGAETPNSGPVGSSRQTEDSAS